MDAEDRFELPTFGIWAQQATTAPLRNIVYDQGSSRTTISYNRCSEFFNALPLNYWIKGLPLPSLRYRLFTANRTGFCCHVTIRATHRIAMSTLSWKVIFHAIWGASFKENDVNRLVRDTGVEPVRYCYRGIFLPL